MMTIIQNKIENSTFNVNTFLRKSTKYLWASAGVLFASYLYFVGAITFSVISQQSINQESKRLISTISQQEVLYLASQRTLTKDFATELGFVTPRKVAYISPKRALAWNVGQ